MAGSVVLATGFEPYGAAANPLLGYGILPGVVTTRDLDRMLRVDDLAQFLPERSEPWRVAFIQCVGSRDRKANRGYCSQFCCRTTIRLAKRVAYLRPGTDIAVFYIDLQVMSKEFAAFYREAGDVMRFVQGVPAEIGSGEGGSLRVYSPAPGESGVVGREFDRAVLAVGMTPSPAQADLARVFGLELNEFGFFRAPEPGLPVLAGRPGVFLAGGCAGPADIQGSRKQALAAAEAARGAPVPAGAGR